MVFPVVMYGCESQTIKKAEHWKIDAFELWCWRRLLSILWTVRISNQSILKEISPEYLLEGLMLKLKLQYFGYLMRRTDSLEKFLMLGKTEGSRRRGWQRKAKQLEAIWYFYTFALQSEKQGETISGLLLHIPRKKKMILGFSAYPISAPFLPLWEIGGL